MNVQIKNIMKKYGKYTALNNFSVTLTNGVYGLLGANGAGKSTLINIIVGLLKPNSGHMKFNDKDIYDIGEKYLEYIGYLPQYPKFYNNFTVLEFMKYMAGLKAIKKAVISDKINEILKFTNLLEQKNKRISQLSGGMRQRLGISQALINDPQFLILDEPTAGLDPKERIRFRNLISRLGENRTVLLATHIVSDVEFIAKEIIIIRKGQKIIQDTPQNLINLISGKIWTAEISSNQLNNMLMKYSINNAYNTENGYIIRFVSEKRPEIENAEQITPNLEDVYMYYFEGE